MMTVEKKPDVTYNDVGGCKEQIENMREANSVTSDMASLPLVFLRSITDGLFGIDLTDSITIQIQFATRLETLILLLRVNAASYVFLLSKQTRRKLMLLQGKLLLPQLLERGHDIRKSTQAKNRSLVFIDRDDLQLIECGGTFKGNLKLRGRLEDCFIHGRLDLKMKIAED
ncbi:hypothetical protein Tco_0988975 [Tanacetum coccineum]|uniref:Uncharacterized protein n=1 Tax=Tanacetum coccineum TaxID=301880 RepID=A0ABQ5ESF4_9ASTR